MSIPLFYIHPIAQTKCIFGCGGDQTQMMRHEKIWDAVIVGGGPAGLSAALILGRSRRTVALVDEGKPRNRVTRHAHGFLTRDGITPAEFRHIAHLELDRYHSVRRWDDVVEEVIQDEDGRFIASLRDCGKLYSRNIIFAAGVKESLPRWRGLDQIYGSSVFLCPYCDGWERRDDPLAVFGNVNGIYSYVQKIFGWSKDLILFTDGPARLDMEQRQALRARRVGLEEGLIAELLHTAEGTLTHVVMNDGRHIARSGGFLMDTNERQATNIPESLGVSLTAEGHYKTKHHGVTDVDGFYIIGDARTLFSGLIGAANDGYIVGEIINNQWLEQEWERSGLR